MTDTRVAALAKPVLAHSQLAFRIGLARSRTASYPLHKLDFIMMDLERPDMSHRHADWCAGDLTGRVLEFLACAEGVDGRHDPRLEELLTRIIRTRRPSGLLGRYEPVSNSTKPPEENINSGAHRLFNGLIKYYEATGDFRGLDTAIGLGDWFVNHKDEWRKRYGHWESIAIEYWITEPLAGLYRHTKDKKYLDMVAMITDPIRRIDGAHAHGFLTTMRGLQYAAIYTGDKSWNEKPEFYRRKIIDERLEMPDGCVCEVFPRSFRNEGCTIADWLMLNLNSAFISGQPEGYEKAENILWNALFFNQFISGGFGHRDMSPNGYLMGPISECWWCCTENAGMAMTEYARHAVCLRGDTVHINLLTPGIFKVSHLDQPEIKVTIRTGFPACARTTITVENLPRNMSVKLRVPTSIKNAQIQEIRGKNGAELILTGDIGHTLEQHGDRVVLRYGPAVLAPMIYYWDMQHIGTQGGAPAGYIADALPGIPKIVADKTDSKGFIELSAEPWPDWSYFETGPDAELSVEGASAHVPVVFDNGDKKNLWFTPLCHITSDMTYYETPILFKR